MNDIIDYMGFSTSRERKKPRSATRTGVVVKVTKFALLFFDDESVTEVWLPFKTILGWNFVDTNTTKGLELRDLEENDAINVKICMWLATKEGLI